MADALTVQSYYESILQSSGYKYEIVPIPNVSGLYAQSSTVTLVHTYEFQNSVKSVICFINAFYSGSVPAKCIQYVPSSTTPTTATFQHYYMTFSASNIYIAISFSDNALKFYTCYMSSGYTNNASIGDVVALCILE